MQIEWNPKTVSTVGTIAFGIIGALSQIRQAWIIWSKRSAEVVSFWWTATFLFMFVGYTAKGLYAESATIASLGILRIVGYIPIVSGVFKFSKKKLTTKDKVLTTLLIAGVGVMAYDHKLIEPLYQVYGYIGLCFAYDQLRKIVQARSPGRVSLVMMCTFIGSTTFWTWYSAVIGLKSMYWLSLSFTIVYSLTAIEWIVAWRYQISLVVNQKPETKTS